MLHFPEKVVITPTHMKDTKKKKKIRAKYPANIHLSKSRIEALEKGVRCVQS